MAKKKKKGASIAAKVFKITGLCLLTIVLLAIIFFATYFISGGFGGSYATFLVRLNGDIILSSRSVSLPSGSTVKIYSFSDYSLSVYAAEDSDFVFIAEDEEYTFSDYAGEDMTAGFEITEDEDGTITISYGTLSEILSAVFGAEVTVTEEIEGEIFELVIESGNSSLRLSFAVDNVYDITIDPDRIVF